MYPYGYGGPNDKHGLNMNDYTELLIKRGGTPDMRRFGKHAPFMIAVYTYKMRRIAGGVSYIASLHMDAAAQSATGPEGEGGDARGSFSALMNKIQAAPDAATMMRVLENNNGELANRILRRLEPYSARLEGSVAHIMKARRKHPYLLRSRTSSKSDHSRSLNRRARSCTRASPLLSCASTAQPR